MRVLVMKSVDTINNNDNKSPITVRSNGDARQEEKEPTEYESIPTPSPR